MTARRARAVLSDALKLAALIALLGVFGFLGILTGLGI